MSAAGEGGLNHGSAGGGGQIKRAGRVLAYSTGPNPLVHTHQPTFMWVSADAGYRPLVTFVGPAGPS